MPKDILWYTGNPEETAGEFCCTHYYKVDGVYSDLCNTRAHEEREDGYAFHVVCEKDY